MDKIMVIKNMEKKLFPDMYQEEDDYMEQGNPTELLKKIIELKDMVAVASPEEKIEALKIFLS